MITLLGRILIKETEEYQKPKIRRMYGILCSVVGVFLNIILFGVKLYAGIVTGSMAIMADGFNNFSDAGSSVVTLIGFKFASMKPDREHPFGHGRFEYVSGLIVSILIILVGFELARSSAEKIWNPKPVETSKAAVIILIVSIITKLYMAFYNYRIGKKIASTAMRATAVDSLSDAVATSFVFASIGVMLATGVNIDGYCGVMVSLFVLWAGYQTAKETVSPLLGGKPRPELIEKIYAIVLRHGIVQGIHDVIVHDYGPGRMMISLHVEVPGDENVFELHDMVEHIESDLDRELDCESVIHMDPVEVKDELVLAMKKDISEIVMQVNQELTIHDFRVVAGDKRTNLVFDVAVSPGFVMTEEEIRVAVTSRISEIYPAYHVVIKVETAYI